MMKEAKEAQVEAEEEALVEVEEVEEVAEEAVETDGRLHMPLSQVMHARTMSRTNTLVCLCPFASVHITLNP